MPGEFDSGTAQTAATPPGPPPDPSGSRTPGERGRARRSARSEPPFTPDALLRLLQFEYENVAIRVQAHSTAGNRWENAASWLRVIVTLTSGISALSIFANSNAMATVFAVITALVAATNSGFSPSERGKKHLDAAVAYGHARRPLDDLMIRFTAHQTVEYVPQTAFDPVQGVYYDAGYYRTTGSTLNSGELGKIYEAFAKLREALETIDGSAPMLSPRFLHRQESRMLRDASTAIRTEAPDRMTSASREVNADGT